MECIEKRVDMRISDPESSKVAMRVSQLLFKINHTLPFTDEYNELLKELFGKNLGKDSFVLAPISGSCLHNMKIGKNVFINSNLLAMARGGIIIEEDVQIAANVQLLTNNHDVYDRQVLTCKPIQIKKGAWIGAGASILPGICIGRYAVVGAASVVTKDVPDYAVVVGNPAKVIKSLNPTCFEQNEK